MDGNREALRADIVPNDNRISSFDAFAALPATNPAGNIEQRRRVLVEKGLDDVEPMTLFDGTIQLFDGRCPHRRELHTVNFYHGPVRPGGPRLSNGRVGIEKS